MTATADTPETAAAPGTGSRWVSLTDGPLPMAAVMAWARTPSSGASVVFTGLVRDHSTGRPGVVRLRYEAYREWVEPGLTDVTTATLARWPSVTKVAALHRVGELRVGEEAVVVAVASSHRRDAFEAASYAIDAVKATVPIWKHETWTGGEGWVSCQELPDRSCPAR